MRSPQHERRGSFLKLILLWFGAAFLIYVVVLFLWFVTIMAALW